MRHYVLKSETGFYYEKEYMSTDNIDNAKLWPYRAALQYVKKYSRWKMVPVKVVEDTDNGERRN